MPGPHYLLDVVPDGPRSTDQLTVVSDGRVLDVSPDGSWTARPAAVEAAFLAARALRQAPLIAERPGLPGEAGRSVLYSDDGENFWPILALWLADPLPDRARPLIDALDALRATR